MTQDVAYTRALAGFEKKGDISNISVTDWLNMGEVFYAALLARAPFGPTGHPPESDAAVMFRLTGMTAASLQGEDLRLYRHQLNGEDYARVLAMQMNPNAPDTLIDRLVLRLASATMAARGLDFATTNDPKDAAATLTIVNRTREAVELETGPRTTGEVRELAKEETDMLMGPPALPRLKPGQTLDAAPAEGELLAGSTDVEVLDRTIAEIGNDPESANRAAKYFAHGRVTGDTRVMAEFDALLKRWSVDDAEATADFGNRVLAASSPGANTAGGAERPQVTLASFSRDDQSAPGASEKSAAAIEEAGIVTGPPPENRTDGPLPPDFLWSRRTARCSRARSLRTRGTMGRHSARNMTGNWPCSTASRRSSRGTILAN